MPKKEENTDVISFRVSKDLYSRLQKYAETQTDEAGLPLNVATGVRRLMRKSLEGWESSMAQQKKKK